jgi:hypothetical protein
MGVTKTPPLWAFRFLSVTIFSAGPSKALARFLTVARFKTTGQIRMSTSLERGVALVNLNLNDIFNAPKKTWRF